MRICAYDCETTDLKALMGRLLCVSFCEIITDDPTNWKVETYRADERRFRSRSIVDDSKLARAVKQKLETYNLVIGWNSKLFDNAFVNARLAKAGIDPLRLQFNLDLMYYAGGVSMRIGSRKLVNVQKYFKLTEAKTEISWEQWQKAAALEKDAMDEVVHHCEQDVLVLGEAYWRLLPSVANLHR